jgi:hypothetical protein
MKPFTRHLSKLAGLVGLGTLSAVAGCQSCGPPFGPECADIPPGSIPAPSGTYVCQWQTAQAERAELDDFVLYINEWADRSAALSPGGQAHVKVLAQRLEADAGPLPAQVLIQQSADPELDQARKATVVQLLAEQGIASAGERVEIGCPEAEGLYGFEAPRIVRGYTQSGTFGSGTSTGAGMGGGGGGFGSGVRGGGFNMGGFF